MHFTTPIFLTTLLTLTSANPAAHPALALPSLPVPAGLALGVPPTATSVINSVVAQAGATGLPIVGGLTSVPGVALPTGLPTNLIPGLPVDPTSLAASISEAVSVLQLILTLLGSLTSGTGTPLGGVGLGVQGTLIASLVRLVEELLPTL